MGKSKKTKTTQGDSRKGSPSDWWDSITINEKNYRAYTDWISNQSHTYDGLGYSGGRDEQADEHSRE